MLSRQAIEDNQVQHDGIYIPSIARFSPDAQSRLPPLRGGSAIPLGVSF